MSLPAIITARRRSASPRRWKDLGALAEREGNLGISASAQRWNAKRSEHRSGGRDILLHEPFERFGNPMDRLGRHKLQALCVAARRTSRRRSFSMTFVTKHRASTRILGAHEGRVACITPTILRTDVHDRRVGVFGFGLERGDESVLVE
jgi:hypothetical protein